MLAQTPLTVLIQTASTAVVGASTLEGAGATIVGDGGVGGEEGIFVDFPIILFCADGEFEVFAGYRIPVLLEKSKRKALGRGMFGCEGHGSCKTYLIDHHDSQ